MIEFDLSDFMVGEPEDGQPPPAPTTAPLPDDHPDKPKRHRRSKAQIEADQAAGVGPKSHRKKDGASTGSAPPSTTADASDTFFDPAPQPTLGMILGAVDQQAFEANRQTDEQRERILGAERNGFPSPALTEAPPDATDTQVLVDEIHFLRDDLRELAAEIRKLTLATERSIPEA